MNPLDFLQSASEHVGIFIGPKKIFLARIDHGGKNPIRDMQVFSVPTPEGSVHDGFISDIDPVARALKKLLSEGHVNARRVVTSIGSTGLLTRVVKLPPMPKEQMRTALKAEVEKSLPGEEMVVDFYELAPGKVFMCAFKKDVVESYLKVMQKAGLDLTVVDVMPFSALRALGRGHIDLTSSQSMLLVLMSGDHFELCIFKDGKPAYVRMLGLKDAEEFLREARLTCEYWVDASGGSRVEKVIVLDEEGEAKGLYEKLAEGLDDVVLERGKPLGKTPDDFGLSQAVSMGLVLRGRGEKQPFDVNLVPRAKLKKDLFIKRSFFSFMFLSCVLIAFFAASLVLSRVTSSSQKRLDTLSEKMSVSSEVVGQLQEVYSQRDLLMRQLDIKRAALDRSERIHWSEVLGDLAKFIPHDVWLTDITSRGAEEPLLLSGVAARQETVYQYVHFLSYSNYLFEPTLDRIDRDIQEGKQRVRFVISCFLAEPTEAQREEK